MTMASTNSAVSVIVFGDMPLKNNILPINLFTVADAPCCQQGDEDKAKNQDIFLSIPGANPAENIPPAVAFKIDGDIRPPPYRILKQTPDVRAGGCENARLFS